MKSTPCLPPDIARFWSDSVSARRLRTLTATCAASRSEMESSSSFTSVKITSCVASRPLSLSLTLITRTWYFLRLIMQLFWAALLCVNLITIRAKLTWAAALLIKPYIPYNFHRPRVLETFRFFICSGSLSFYMIARGQTARETKGRCGGKLRIIIIIIPGGDYYDATRRAGVISQPRPVCGH